MPCDTAALTVDADDGGRYTVFLKNSDRHPSEPQVIEVHPEKDHHAAAVTLRTTYAEIPQVRHTFATCISRPERMWGAEMGVNEFGLCVGNEAVFSSLVSIRKTNHQILTGMDLVRLCLERCRSALECVDLIADMASEWPIGGNCGLDDQHPFYYHNGFVFTDATGRKVAMILLGREWLAVDHSDAAGAVALSNSVASLRSTFWDTVDVRLSDGMRALLSGTGALWPHNSSDTWTGALRRLVGRGYPWLCDYFANGSQRAGCTFRSLVALSSRTERPSREAMILQCFSVLRQHNCGSGESPTGWLPRLLNAQFWLRNDVCMHAGPGPVRLTSTTNALVVEVRICSAPTTSAFEGVRAWSTLSSNPCLTPLKPIDLESSRPGDCGVCSPGSDGLRFSARWTSLEWWWRVERVHRLLHRQLRVASGVDSVDTCLSAELLKWIHEAERKYVVAVDKPATLHPSELGCIVAPHVLDGEDNFYRQNAGIAELERRDRMGATAPWWNVLLRIVASPLAVLYSLYYNSHSQVIEPHPR